MQLCMHGSLSVLVYVRVGLYVVKYMCDSTNVDHEHFHTVVKSEFMSQY